MANRDVVLCHPVRTAIGNFNGTLKDTPAPELGAVVIRETMRRSGLAPERIGSVVMGNVIQAGNRMPERSLTQDEMLDDITLYWLTNTATSASQLYWENNNNNFNVVEQRTREIKVPVGVTVFPGEIYQAPKSWAQRAFPRLTYFNEVDKGGHFAAWEEPQLFAAEVRAAFKSVR